MANAPNQLLTSLLRDVSRSFYLTLRVLPRRIRQQIGLGYLLARTTDTIADTELVPLPQRLEALRALRGHILGLSQGPINFGELARLQTAAPERVLLEQVDASLALLGALAAADQRLVQEVLETITSGQELDLRRFDGAGPDHILSLRSDADLDDYTYRVAGCVGEFWTRICLAHLFAKTSLDEAYLLANGVRFGKGLQMVNILRDLPSDLRQGRCYLPADRLSAFDLVPADLLQPANEGRLRPLYHQYLDQAEAHLRAGWDYTNTLPRRSVRVRLACAWPVLIGLDTLRLLRVRPLLDPNNRTKVSRSDVRRILWRSVLYYPWRSAWRSLAG
jgi:farnesyl-diphosphate farnesyltransferase